MFKTYDVIIFLLWFQMLLQETEPFHIVSPSDWPSQTPASRRLLAQGWRMISSSGLTRPSRLILSARAVNVVVLSVAPPIPEKLFCVLTASFFSWRNAPVWPQQRRRVCYCKISDQRNGSGRNVIRPVVINLFARWWQVPAYASCTYYRCWIPELFISIWDFISKSY